MDKDFAVNVIKETPDELVQAPKKGISKFLGQVKGPKIVFFLLGIVVVVELIVAGVNLFAPSQTQFSNPAPSIQPMTEAKIVLVSKGAVSVGEKFPLQVRVFTGGKSSDGMDVVLRYDSNVLDVNKTDITTGGLFSDYPLIEVDKKGMIKISAVDVSSKAAFNGMGILATINFSAKKMGPTTVTVEHTIDVTTDSNVIEARQAKDMLGSVENASIVVGSATSVSSSICSSRAQYRCVDSEGKTGTYWCNQLKDGLACNIGCFTSIEGIQPGCKVVTVTQ